MQQDAQRRDDAKRLGLVAFIERSASPLEEAQLLSEFPVVATGRNHLTAHYPHTGASTTPFRNVIWAPNLQYLEMFAW